MCSLFKQDILMGDDGGHRSLPERYPANGRCQPIYDGHFVGKNCLHIGDGGFSGGIVVKRWTNINRDIQGNRSVSR
jgi:hypothetical protein